MKEERVKEKKVYTHTHTQKRERRKRGLLVEFKSSSINNHLFQKLLAKSL